MENTYTERKVHKTSFGEQIRKRSDRLVNNFLICFFVSGIIIAPFYDTWGIALGVGGSCLLAYYISKAAFPNSSFIPVRFKLGNGCFFGTIYLPNARAF